MIITTSVPALILAMVTFGALPTEQVHVDRSAGSGIGTVTSNEELRTDTPWLENETLLAYYPLNGYVKPDSTTAGQTRGGEACTA